MDEKKTDSTQYSASKAPETSRAAEEKDTIRDFRLIPGGRHGSQEPIGMSAMNREDVPSEGRDEDLANYGDSPDTA
jgi:hypothetical protein